MKHDRPHQRLALRQEPRPVDLDAELPEEPTPIHVTFNLAQSDLPLQSAVIQIFDAQDNLIATEWVDPPILARDVRTYVTSYIRAWTRFTVGWTFNNSSPSPNPSFTTQPQTLYFTHDDNNEADYIGATQDLVGAWGSTSPNGYVDAEFEIFNSVNLPIKSITVSVDENPGWFWSTVNPANYIMGVAVAGGPLVNTSGHTSDLNLSCYQNYLRLFCCTVSTGGNFTGLTWRFLITYSDDSTKELVCIN